MHHAVTRCGYVGIVLLNSQICIRMNNVLTLLLWQMASQQLYASDLSSSFEMVYSPLEFFKLRCDGIQHCLCSEESENFEIFISRL